MFRLIRQSKWLYRFEAGGLICLLIILSGCNNTKPRDVKPSFEIPLEFSAHGIGSMPEQWWHSLHDAQLNAIIEEALTENFTIRSAWDRLTQAEQTAIKSGVQLFPVATYQAGAERLRRSTSGNVTYTSDYFAGLGVAYEIDFWGRIRSSRQAAVLDAQAARENVNIAAMTLTSAIAKTWYQLAEAKKQVDIITQQIQTNEKILEVIKLQFRKAQVGAADVFGQQELVQSSRGQLIQAQKNIALLQHQLSILIGKAPAKRWSHLSIELVRPEQLPQVDVPAVVIQRRPDVMSAYRTVQAADRRMASAIADQYPSVSLSANTETSAEKVSDLFEDWLSNLAINLTGPLFDAGLRKTEVQRTLAIVSERLNDYNQTVLEALQETEDAISQEYYQRQYVQSIQKQLELARNVYERTYQNYLKGQLDYIRVLNALVSMQNLEQNELTARRILIEYRIDLCRSIAGSWQMKRPANEELVNASFFDKKK